jgi:GNAT superfamily N-acetyltransferase
MEGETPVGAGLVYARGDGALIFGVSTVPAARGRGVARALVEWILTHPPATREPIVATISENRRLERRLGGLGFESWARFRVYELNPDAELTLPPLGRSGGPLWRPPRAGPKAPST